MRWSASLFLRRVCADPLSALPVGAAVLHGDARRRAPRHDVLSPASKNHPRFTQRKLGGPRLDPRGCFSWRSFLSIGIAWFFIRETADLVPAAQNLLEELRNHDWPTLEARLPSVLQQASHYLSDIFTRMNLDPKQVVLDNVQVLGAQATGWATGTLRNILVTFFNALILSVVLFFAFRDGEKFVEWAYSLIPMQAKHKHIVAKRVNETFRAVVIGSILTAAAQGATAMIGVFLSPECVCRLF